MVVVVVPGCFIFTVSRSTQKCNTNTRIFVDKTHTLFLDDGHKKHALLLLATEDIMRFPPLFARLATVLCLLATTCPKLPLLRDALERIDDALDDFAMMKRRSKRRRKHDDDEEEEEEENSDDSDDDDSDDDDEESLLLIKKSADSIAALRAMEHRRGRRALVKDAFAKKLAGERNTNSNLLYIT